MAKNVENDVLLTIAIPTYNRAAYLDLCLRQIFNQVKRYESLVEVIISDNCSADNTAEIIHNYARNGFNFKYVCNDENVGADRNVVQCFNLANGKYVLILGDDDVLLNGSVDKIINLLKERECGVVFLTGYGFKNDYLTEKPNDMSNGFVVYREKDKFIRRVHFYLTFLSGNIVNKESIKSDIDPSEFIGTNLPQLNWILSAIFKSEQNVCFNEYMIAAKTENTGGYKLCQVFGVGFNVIAKHFIEKGISKSYLDIINNRIMKSFFPHYILNIRKSEASNEFINENYYQVLKKIYGNYFYFWLIIVPVISLPINLAVCWYKTMSIIVNIINKMLLIKLIK